MMTRERAVRGERTIRRSWRALRRATLWLTIGAAACGAPVWDRGLWADEPAPKPTRTADDAAPKADSEKSPTTDDAAKRRAEDAEFYELLKLFTDTLDQIDRNYVKDVSRRELMEAAIRGMIGKLDQYSNYIPPDEMESFRGSVENEFGGIGIQVAVEQGRLTVISPLVGTPAYRAGIQAGDWVTEIAGLSTRDMTLDDAVKKMKGQLGSEVHVTIMRPGDPKPRKLTLSREIIKVETVLGERRGEKDAWDFMFDDQAKIGYLRITSFGRQTTGDVQRAMKQLSDRKLRGLILDLRFNPGGLLSSAIEISDLFVSEGKIVSTAGRNTPERVVRAAKEGTYEDFPIAVLVNRYSASASEIVSACLQDHRRAVVIGERTWGKGSVQNIVELEDGRSAIKLTTAGYLRPNGKNIHRFEGASEADEWGVRPDDGFEIKLPDDELRKLIEDRRERDIVRPKEGEAPPKSEFVDRQLQKALEYLKEKAPPEKPTDEKPSDAAKANETKGATPPAPGDE